MNISVDEYGAIGDGTADDTTAIQAAITAAIQQGVTVTLTAGSTYATDATITIPGPVTLAGDGAVIRSRSGGTALRLSSSHITVSGLTIVGNGGDVYWRNERGILSTGTPATPFTGCRIEGVTIRDMGDTALRVDWWTDSIITGCRIENVTYAGVFVQSARRVRVTKTTVQDVWQHDAPQSYGISITDSENTIEGQSRDCTVDHCAIINVPHWTGLSTHGGARIVFLSNLVIGCHRGIVYAAGNPTRVVTPIDGVALRNTIDGAGAGGSVGMAVIGQFSGAESTVYESGNLVYNHARTFEATTNGRWLDAPPSFYAPGEVAKMPTLEVRNPSGEWETIVAGSDGAQGPPGPASPHEGSNIAVGVRQYGAVGDGTTDDTAAVQAAIDAAGSYGFVDFEAGTYKITSGLSSWLNVRKTGPGVLTDGTLEQYISPRYDGDLYVLHVDGDNGSDLADGLFPHSAFKTLARLDEAFSKLDADQIDRGRIIVRMSGEFEGHRFDALPHTRQPILFEGEPLAGGEPVTTIRRTSAQIGIHVQPAVGRTVTFRNLAFKDFTGGSGFGMLWAQGGSVRVENCLAENCGTGFAMRDNANMSVLDTTARNCTTSGFRSQYFANGAWTRCTATACFEGFHVSRNSVMHVDYCVADDSTRSGLWLDMSARAQTIGSTYRRNGWYGVRGETHATVDINQVTGGGNIFGTGADANGFKDVSLAGTAVLAATEGVYAIPEHLADAQSGSWTTSVQMRNGRQLQDYRIGRGARMRIRAWGTGGGAGTSVEVRFGSTSVRTISTTTGSWLIELTAQHDDGTNWQILSTLNGAGPTIQSVPSVREDLRPTLVATGVTIRGVEFYTGG